MHVYNNVLLLGYFRGREAAVGKRFRTPCVLIAAEVCVIFTNLLVF